MIKKNHPKPTPLKALIYARTSKKTQNTGRQIADLTVVAKAQQYKVVKVITEKISGAVSNDKRKGIGELMEYINNNRVDIILTAEVSRLGRSPFETNKIVEEITQLKIPIYFHSYRIITLIKDEKGNYRRNPLAMILYNLLNEFSFLEREMLISRVVSGIESARKRGVVLGRKKGSLKSNDVMMKQYYKVIKDIRKNIPLRKLMVIHDISKGTVIKLKKMVASSKSH